MVAIEKTDTVRQRKAFAVANVDCYVTPFAWLSVPIFISLGIACAVAMQSGREIGEYLQTGFVYGVLLHLSNTLHTVGHVIAGKIVGSPGGAVRVTSTFHVNYHDCDPAICTKWKHIGRSLGGPLINLLLGGVVLLLVDTTGHRWFAFLGSANLIVGGWLLLPIPRLDGWVIWGELLGFRRRVKK
jgi:hypothetical protein